MTELIWEGKYKDGKKVAPVRIALPFQTIETINESAADRQKRLNSLFNQKQETGDWRNRLIWGDKKYVLPSLLPEFAGKVNLIYIDPPFNVGSDFSFTATIGDHPDDDEGENASFTKEPSIIEQKAYRDTWGKGLDSYMQWFYETVVLLRELLAEDGSIYVHLDWHVGQYAKVILDEVFGYDKFRAEIMWKKTTKTTSFKNYGSEHDVIYYYVKGDEFIFNQEFKALKDSELLSKYVYLETPQGQILKLSKEQREGKAKLPEGRRFRGIPLINMNQNRPNLKYEFLGHTKVWAAKRERLEELQEKNLIFQIDGGLPQKKGYLDENQGAKVNDVWDDINPVNSQALERVEYATQKPEKLIERILKVSSKEGDLVMDCFCGSGTTAATAEKLNRRWITCDLGRFAIHTARKRFLGIPDVKPFVVQNLGKYERQQWVQAEFDNPQGRLQQEKSYKNFLCELYHAKPLEGYTWIHGAKAGRMIHVGSVETPVTVDDIKAAILEFWKLVGKEKSTTTNGIDFLGWDFAFDVNETAAQFAKSNKVDVKFKKIPREVLEKKAVEQGDIKFYELASLNIKTKISKNQLTITLDNFIIPPDDIPEEVRGSITHWSQWIDYWSIDWNYRDDTFHNEWQSYRTKQNPKIELTATNQFEQNGKFTVLVKVIDILGNDTTKAIQIEI
jgi:adenine-specific DNA-methyltransferase